MATTTPTTFRVECDDVALMVVRTDDPDYLLALPWPTWLTNLDHEPNDREYDRLVEDMVDNLYDLLGDEAYVVNNDTQFRRAVRTAVLPGGVPAESDLRFDADEVHPGQDPATDTRKVQVRAWDSNGPVTVSLDDVGIDGDRRDEVATIKVDRGINWSMRLTWNEARALAAALTEITDIAENG